MDVLLHPKAEASLALLRSALPQSTLLSGPRGIGLLSAAKWIAGAQLVNTVQPKDVKLRPDSENGTITVEMIRELYDQTRAKHTRAQIIIIDDADRMSLGAQAAFLKLLEEPNAHIYFLLTSHHPQKLLATIRSRLQSTILQTPTAQQSREFIASLGVTDQKKLAQLQFIAEGLPAELTRLVHDEAYFKERAEIVGDARDFLQADTYQKLLIVQKYKVDRAATLQLIGSALQILRRSMSTKPQYSISLQLAELLVIKERIASNHNAMLQLTRFVL